MAGGAAALLLYVAAAGRELTVMQLPDPHRHVFLPAAGAARWSRSMPDVPGGHAPRSLGRSRSPSPSRRLGVFLLVDFKTGDAGFQFVSQPDLDPRLRHLLAPRASTGSRCSSSS